VAPGGHGIFPADGRRGYLQYSQEKLVHQNNIVHRDIKPENMLINEEGRLKVIDFNISKVRVR
jgi:serine/threonine protein kinase